MSPIDNTQLLTVVVFESDKTSDTALTISVPGLPVNFKRVASDREFLNQIRNSDCALAIMNSVSNIDTIRPLIKNTKSQSPETKIIVIAEEKKINLSAELTEIGVSDCLFHPVQSRLLVAKITDACEAFKNNRELMVLRQQVAMSYAFDNFVGISAEIQKIKRTIQNVINNDFPVILSGEDGTGKNLLAKIIHYHSSRRKSPLAYLDCSALTESQIETELLGTTNETGNNLISGELFNRAAGGTVFIDKFHLLSAKVSTKLQTLLLKNVTKAGCFQSGGSEFRLLISLNDALYDSYTKGTIDRRFIDSINAIEINLSPLRERTGDIELLTAYFLRMIAFENDSKALAITPAAVEILKTHQWPGNVRELENCLRRASALCNEHTIDVTDVSFISANLELNRLVNIMKSKSNRTKSLADGQRQLISDALDANEWNFSQTAKQLGIGRTTLWRKVRKFNLKRGAESVNETELVEENA